MKFIFLFEDLFGPPCLDCGLPDWAFAPILYIILALTIHATIGDYIPKKHKQHTANIGLATILLSWILLTLAIIFY